MARGCQALLPATAHLMGVITADSSRKPKQAREDTLGPISPPQTWTKNQRTRTMWVRAYALTAMNPPKLIVPLGDIPLSEPRNQSWDTRIPIVSAPASKA